ncbi:hypothetical protein [Bradyrhizobium betae]|uniref:hypothetical protein n=1 Tax=Bradyrhizobium betae TaxID=244734 RepID=UPI0019D70211|nr:hypothetical protein [Bradyrhizobium betae]
MLGLSTPDLPQRNCIFMIHPQITSAVFTSKEGKIVFPDRPTEYPCGYARKTGGTDIAFTNQNGWRFEVRIGCGDEGSWKANLADDAVSGRAFSPFGGTEGGEPIYLNGVGLNPSRALIVTIN